MAATHRPPSFSMEDKLQAVMSVRELIESGDCRTVPEACAAAGVTLNRYDYFSNDLRQAGYDLPRLALPKRLVDDSRVPMKRGFTTDAAFIPDDGKKHKPVAVVMSERGVPVGWFDSWAEADELAFDVPGSRAVAG